MSKEENIRWWNGLLEYVKIPKDKRPEISQEYSQTLLQNGWELFPIGSKVIVNKKVVASEPDDKWELSEEGTVTEHGWSVHQPGASYKLIGVYMANYKYGKELKYNVECTAWDLQLLQIPKEVDKLQHEEQ